MIMIIIMIIIIIIIMIIIIIIIIITRSFYVDTKPAIPNSGPKTPGICKGTTRVLIFIHLSGAGIARW